MLGVQCSCTCFSLSSLIPEIVIIVINASKSVTYKIHDTFLKKYSCEFFVYLSCISFRQYFQINIFKSVGFGKIYLGA